MTKQQSNAELISAYLVDLYGGDPYREVYDACEPHRDAHGPDCGVYPSDAPKMRVLATLVRASGARRVLEIGGGLGYSALWLADVLPEGGKIETIDRFAEHTSLIERYAAQFRLGDKIDSLHGEGEDILKTLSGPYDFIHDDGWFGRAPSYYERMVELLRPGGLLVLSNWFLLEQALTRNVTMDWSQLAGPNWADDVIAYAHNLTADPRLYVSFIMQPSWVALACKRA